MVKLAVLLALVAITGSAADFSLTIGPAVAAGTDNKAVKKTGAQFAVRLEECADLSQARIDVKATNSNNGTRSESPVIVESAGKLGTYLVSQTSFGPGNLVVTVSASCGNAKAGAVVPIGPQGFLRDSVKTFPHAVTTQDVDAGFRALDRH